MLTAGESIKELQGSPFLEQLLAKDYEVIFFTDPVDEYLMQNLQDYDDIKFQNASKDDLKLADKDQKKENKKLKVKPLVVALPPGGSMMCLGKHVCTACSNKIKRRV